MTPRRPWWHRALVVLAVAAGAGVLVLLTINSPDYDEGLRRAGAASTARRYLGHLVSSPPEDLYALACPAERQGRTPAEYASRVLTTVGGGAVVTEATVSHWNAAGSVELEDGAAFVMARARTPEKALPLRVRLEPAGDGWLVCGVEVVEE